MQPDKKSSDSGVNKQAFGSKTKFGARLWRRAGFLGLSFLAGVLGSWTALSSGLFKQDTSQNSSQSAGEVIRQKENTIAGVAQNLGPSVVSIVVDSSNATPFGNVAVQSAGTGIIISKNGYILTNKHVIPEGAESVSIVKSDGTKIENVQVAGRDPLNDIAFLKIQNVNDLAAAQLGDSSTVKIGQEVVAIGNTLGEFPNTVTSGIISGIGRPVTAGSGAEAQVYENLFQTDAAINPGNSGGPLVNLEGKVIGINTAVAADAQGVGFAIPINDAKGLIKTVTATGKVARAYIGVRYTTINPEIAKKNNLPVKRGALIQAAEGQNPVLDGSPAAKAGLKADDIITKVNNTAINERQTLASLVAQYTPGDTIKLSVIRGDNTREIKVKLEELQQ